MKPTHCTLLALVALFAAGSAALAAPGDVAPRPASVPGFGPGFRGLFSAPPNPTPLPAAPAAGMARPATAMPAPGASPGALCRAAISAAELRHGIPSGLMQAIGLVESGRTDPATGTRLPWPWAVNAEGRGMMFDTRDQAVAWVRTAQAGGMRSIDTGCMQVNQMFHPHAFNSLEQAFDPMANADYAARFLRQLKETVAGGDWMKAAGFYHSQTPERAEPYRAKVQATLGGLPAVPRAAAVPALPGGGGQSLSNRADQASLLPAMPGAVGRGLDAYRLRPIPVAGALPAGTLTPPGRPLRTIGAAGP